MILRVKWRRKPVVRLGGKPQRKTAGKLTKKRAIGLMSGLTSGCLKAQKGSSARSPLKVHRWRTVAKEIPQMTPCSISLALRKLIALTSIPMDGARIGSQRIGQFRLRGHSRYVRVEIRWGGGDPAKDRRYAELGSALIRR